MANERTVEGLAREMHNTLRPPCDVLGKGERVPYPYPEAVEWLLKAITGKGDVVPDVGGAVAALVADRRECSHGMDCAACESPCATHIAYRLLTGEKGDPDGG